MTTPERPKDPPAAPAKVDHDPGPAQNGIPEGTKDADANAWPNDDRQATETAGNPG